jgi:hypothetical protein
MNDAAGEIQITDVTGRVLGQFTMPESKRLTVNTAEYPAGLYFYQYAHGTTESGRFVITH